MFDFCKGETVSMTGSKNELNFETMTKLIKSLPKLIR